MVVVSSAEGKSGSPRLRWAAGRHTPAWVVLTLVAAAGLLVGYTLSVAERLVRGQQAAVLTHMRLFQAPNSYAVLSSGTWSRSPWGKECSTSTAAADDAQRASKPSVSKHLCELPQIWTNCSQGIYLDIGTNVGVQLRKLYDPQQFPGAAVLPIFDEVFGSRRSGVCAIGVEANPHHTAYLGMLNGYFMQRGYQAVVLTEVAASIRSGSTAFFLDTDNPVEWGASLTQGDWQKNSQGQAKATVQLLDLPDFVSGVVRPILQQELRASGRLPPVVMKLDVEGEEYALFPGLMLSGGLCDISVLFLEIHHESFRNADGVEMKMLEMEEAFAKMRKANPHCRVQVTNLDDESYLDGKAIPFPLWEEVPNNKVQSTKG